MEREKGEGWKSPTQMWNKYCGKCVSFSLGRFIIYTYAYTFFFSIDTLSLYQPQFFINPNIWFDIRNREFLNLLARTILEGERLTYRLWKLFTKKLSSVFDNMSKNFLYNFSRQNLLTISNNFDRNYSTRLSKVSKSKIRTQSPLQYLCNNSPSHKFLHHLIISNKKYRPAPFSKIPFVECWRNMHSNGHLYSAQKVILNYICRMEISFWQRHKTNLWQTYAGTKF